MSKLRTVFYARVSTDKEDQLHSFTSQQDYFKKFILAQSNMLFIKGYADEGISGVSTKHRVAFLKMMEDARLGKFDLILTKEVSRFARNTVDTLSYTRELSKLNIGVIFTNDGIDTRQKDGELRLSIMASLAQDESRKISDRVNWAVQRNYEKGIAHGGMPFGYRRNKNKEIIIYEPEAEIVKRIFNLYILGNGCRRIIKELCKDEEIRPIIENWSDSRVLRMIQNPKYCGELVQGLSYTEDFLTKSRKKQTDPSKWYRINNHHEPIISTEIFQKAQQERLRRQKIKNGVSKKKFSSAYVFSNKIECCYCHHDYIRKTRIKDGKRYTNWVCSTKSRIGRNHCPKSKNLKEEALYEIMKTVYDFLYIQKEDVLFKLERIFSVLIFQKNVSQEKWIHKKNELVEQLNRLVDLNIQGFIDSNIFLRKYNHLQLQIDRLDNKINQIILIDTQDRFQKIMNTIDNLVCHWEEIQDELISKILYKIEIISKEEYIVYLTFGMKISFPLGKCEPFTVSME